MKTKIGAYLRRQRHIHYVESYVIQLRTRLCSQAIMYRNVDRNIRDLFLKYNEYLRQLKKDE